jgi:hypothetical protein
MNKRLLNFAEYLKEELKINLTNKKFKASLEALLLVADGAIHDYCNGDKPKKYGAVINELMEMDGYADVILYNVAATLLSTMEKSELKNLKEGGVMPKVRLTVKTINPSILSVYLVEDKMYTTDVTLTKDEQILPNDQFKIVNVPGEAGAMEASELLIKISEKNTEDTIAGVQDGKTQVNQINAIKGYKSKFSLAQVNGGYNPMTVAILIPPVDGIGTGAKLAAKAPYIEASGTSATEIPFKTTASVKRDSKFKTESAELEAGFAESVAKEIEDKIENAKKEAIKKLGPDAKFDMKISKLEVLSSASNAWGTEKIDPTEEMDFDAPSRTTTTNTEKNDDLAKKRAESFEEAIITILKEKKVLGKDVELSKKWKVTDTGGKTDQYNIDNKTGKPAGQFVEVRMNIEASGVKSEPGQLSAYLEYTTIELGASFYAGGGGGEDFLNIEEWDFTRPKYTRKGPLKNIDFGKSLDFSGLPWWLKKRKGGGGRDWIGGRS